MILCIFYQVNLTGSGLLNRTGAEIGYKLDFKNAKNHFLLLKKFKNTESAQLWTVTDASRPRATLLVARKRFSRLQTTKFVSLLRHMVPSRCVSRAGHSEQRLGGINVVLEDSTPVTASVYKQAWPKVARRRALCQLRCNFFISERDFHLEVFISDGTRIGFIKAYFFLSFYALSSKFVLDSAKLNKCVE